MVNRIWQHLFGQGLVRTPENFGAEGESPTHPELLEWLAAEFMTTPEWQVKPLIREIMLSTAYQQTSTVAANLPAQRRASWQRARRTSRQTRPGKQAPLADAH